MVDQRPGVDPAGGCLYVVATPIGHLNDITLRALEVLKTVDLVAAEDTRHTRTLLNHFGIDRPLMSLHDHNESARIDSLGDRLAAGQRVALVSDAGTPLISDPGFKLVRELRLRGYAVVPVPGACAAIAALSVSGLPTDRFTFVGFLPARSAARREALEAFVDSAITLVIYESPRRVLECLADAAAVLGASREVVVARELTKLHEELFSGSLAEAVAHFSDEGRQRGEFVLLVAGASDAGVTSEIDGGVIAQLRLAGKYLPPKQACALVAELTGHDKKLLYRHWTEMNEAQ